MRKILLVLLITLLCFAPMTFAEEVQEVATQDTDIDASGVVAVINKQPEETGIIQKIRIRRSGLVLVVNVNGKVQIAPDSED